MIQQSSSTQLQGSIIHTHRLNRYDERAKSLPSFSYVVVSSFPIVITCGILAVAVSAPELVLAGLIFCSMNLAWIIPAIAYCKYRVKKDEAEYTFSPSHLADALIEKPAKPSPEQNTKTTQKYNEYFLDFASLYNEVIKRNSSAFEDFHKANQEKIQKLLNILHKPKLIFLHKGKILWTKDKLDEKIILQDTLKQILTILDQEKALAYFSKILKDRDTPTDTKTNLLLDEQLTIDYTDTKEVINLLQEYFPDNANQEAKDDIESNWNLLGQCLAPHYQLAD